MIVRFLTSVRLTLGLLLALAGVAVFGTIWPSRETELDVFRYELFYQSPWYRLILVLLALNLVACTLRSIRRRWRERPDLLARLATPASGPGIVRIHGGFAVERVASVLRRAGFRVVAGDGGFLARSGMANRWGVVVIHVAVLLIMAGGLAAEFGFVGTLSIYEGDTQGEVFDWEAQADTDLGFALRLDDFEPVFYPIEVQFAVIDPRSGSQVAAIEAREGETVELPMSGYQARVARFDPFVQRLEFVVLSPDGGEFAYVAQAGVKDPEHTVAGYVLYPTAYRDPLIKQQRSRVTIFQNGRILKQGLIEVNRPLTVAGYTIFQTAYGRNESGHFFAGFQISRDPGEWLVWAGCVVLILGLFMNLYPAYRAIGVRFHGDSVELEHLAGFSHRNSDDTLERLAKILQQGGETKQG